MTCINHCYTIAHLGSCRVYAGHKSSKPMLI